MRYKYKVCKGQKVLALSTTLHEAKAEAKRVGGRVVPVGRKNPPDPEYATMLGGGSFSKAYGRPPQAKDFRGTPIDAGPRGVEAITGRGGMYNFDSFDAGKTALILARKALIAKKNYAAAKYLPEITPVRLDKNSVGVREYVYAMPYYTQWMDAWPRPEVARLLFAALEKDGTGTGTMLESATIFKKNMEYYLASASGDTRKQLQAEIKPVVDALTAIHVAVHKMGVNSRRDYYGSDMHQGNFALDGQQLILLDPVAVDLPEKVLDKVWQTNGWAAKPPKQAEGTLYKLLKRKRSWPQTLFTDIGNDTNHKRWQEFAALLYPLLADAGPGTQERIYSAMRRLGAISEVSYDKDENGNIVHIYAMVPATKFPDNAELVLEAIAQGWWNPRESEKSREFLENLLKKQNPRKKNPERTWIPPAEVAAEARKALELRAKQPASNKCCTPVGIARAKQLANRQPVSETTLRRMKAYFDRHAVDAKGKGWKVDSKGWQAWLAWGSDAGREWCEKILRGL